jgi:hypothetical protein
MSEPPCILCTVGSEWWRGFRTPEDLVTALLTMACHATTTPKLNVSHWLHVSFVFELQM